MKHVNFEATNGLIESSDLPTSWQDIPFWKYPAMLKLIEDGNGKPDSKEIFKLFFGLSQKMVDSNFKLEQLHAMNEQLNFLSTEPTTKELATHFKFKDQFIRIPKDISELSLGKYRDIVETGSETLTGSDSSPITMMKTFPEIIAIFCAPEGYSQTKLDDMAEVIGNYPTPEVVSIGNFFMNQFATLKNGTKKDWFKRQIVKIMPMNKQSFPKSLKILVTC